MTETLIYQPKRAMHAAIASVVTVIVLIVIKTIALLMTGSVSILASLIDSLSDAVVSGMNALAIHISLLPADKNHRHGHGKVEGLAALLQAAFITGAGVFLALESVRRLAEPQDIQAHGVAIIVMAVAIVLSVGLVLVQNRILRAAPSLAVQADRAHYSSDIVVNGGVIAALAVQSMGGPWWIDPVFALGVAGWLGWLAWGIGRQGIDMLLDRELPRETRTRIEDIIRAEPRIHGIHDLRTRASGMQIYIYFDVELDPDMKLIHAHDITRDIEIALVREFPNAEVMIHMDPLGDIDDSRHSVPGVHH